MPLLKDTFTAPPGGWVYTQQETGLVLKSESFDGLVQRVAAHRIYRELPRTKRQEVSEDVQSQIIARVGPEFGIPGS